MLEDRRKTISVVLWLAAAVITAGLVHQRYHAAISGGVGGDFSVYLRAAQQVAAGHSPYATNQLFVYPPTLALSLAPFSRIAQVDLWHAWTLLELTAIVVGVVAFVAARAPDLTSWARPVLFIFCAVTVLHFWPLTIGLYLGQADAFVFVVLLLSSLAASRERPVARGVLVGVAGLLNGWPAAVGLSLLQRGGERRLRSLVPFVVTILLAPILAVVFGGGSGLVAFVKAVVAARTQHLVSDSVWGAPSLLFSHSGLAVPLFASLPLQVLITAILLVWVLGLLVIALRTRGDKVMCTWNVTFCIVLLLPVSHLAYTLYCLPVLWIWGARLLRDQRFGRRELIAPAVLVIWWLVQTKSWPDSGSSAAIASVHYCVVFAANLVACTASVIGAWLVPTSEAAVALTDPTVLIEDLTTGRRAGLHA